MSAPSTPSPAATQQDDLFEAVKALVLRATATPQNRTLGIHPSPKRGNSIEFREHRRYAHGDDPRKIDWRAVAKTNTLYVKHNEDERRLRMQLMVDTSGSMGFAHPASSPSKLAYAVKLAGAFAYLALQQGDAVGLTSIASHAPQALQATHTSKQLLRILAALQNLEAKGQAHISESLAPSKQASMHNPSLIVLFSDLWDPNLIDPQTLAQPSSASQLKPEQEPKLKTGQPTHALVACCRRWMAQGHEVRIFQILDPSEISFPFDTPAQFCSMENKDHMLVHPQTLKRAYQKMVQRHLKETERFLRLAGVSYQLVQTDADPAQVLRMALMPHGNKGSAR